MTTTPHKNSKAMGNIADSQDLVTPKIDISQVANLNLAQMLEDINDIVSGEWGYSVTDDMVWLPTGEYSEFTQAQAQEMSKAISKVYMIAHAISCSGCGSQYRVSDLVATNKESK